MATIRVKGLDELMQAFVQAGTHAPRYAAAALYEEASEAMYLSQMRVPVRTGALKASGVVHPPTVIGNVAHCSVTYGGPATPYAIYVHEIPPSRARHDAPTAWKYLEYPVKVLAKGMAQRMTVRVLDMVNRRFG